MELYHNHSHMSEKLTPSGKPYTGPKHNLKEDLATLTDRIDAMDEPTTAKELGKYLTITP